MSPELLGAALRIASLIALVGLGFNLLYGVGRFINLAHGELLLMAALLGARLGRILPIWPAIGLSVVAFGLAGVVVGRLVFHRLRGQRSTAMLGASLGLALLLQAVWTACTSSASVVLPSQTLLTHPAALLVLVVLLTVGLAAWIRFSQLGRTLRAVTVNPDLAEGWGMPVEAAHGALFGIAFALTALAGCSVAANYALSAGFSFKILLWSFAAILLGGIGRPLGGVIAAFPVAGAWALLAGQGLEPYVDAILLLACAIFYYARPAGIFGESLRLI